MKDRKYKGPQQQDRQW